MLIHNDLAVGLLLQFFSSHDMIEVAMSDENTLERQTMRFELG